MDLMYNTRFPILTAETDTPKDVVGVVSKSDILGPQKAKIGRVALRI